MQNDAGLSNMIQSFRGEDKNVIVFNLQVGPRGLNYAKERKKTNNGLVEIYAEGDSYVSFLYFLNEAINEAMESRLLSPYICYLIIWKEAPVKKVCPDKTRYPIRFHRSLKGDYDIKFIPNEEEEEYFLEEPEEEEEYYEEEEPESEEEEEEEY